MKKEIVGEKQFQIEVTNVRIFSSNSWLTINRFNPGLFNINMVHGQIILTKKNVDKCSNKKNGCLYFIQYC